MSGIFVEGEPAITIRRDNVVIVFTAAEPTTICIPLWDFRQAVAKAVRTLKAYDAKLAAVVPIKGKPKR